MQIRNNIQKQNSYKINTIKSNNKRDNSNKTFKGGIADGAFNVLDGFFRVLDKEPMWQVGFVDTVSTNIPRTYVDAKTGLAAALETFRREFSGLFVNCLMPGFIVMGIAALLPKGKELAKTKVVSSWANEDTVNKLSTVYNNAQKSGAEDKTREFVSQAIASLSGLDGRGGNKWKKFADYAGKPEYNEAITNITKAISAEKNRDRKDLINKAKDKFVGLTKTESILKFNDTPHSNLQETLRDITNLGANFNTVKERTVSSLGESVNNMSQAQINEKITGAVNKYGKSLKKFINAKSFIGLGITIGIAVSMQKINRAITRKQFNAEGAPIYKDFGKKDTTQKMDEKQKKAFKVKKAVSALSMFGLAALSMMKKPTRKMFQFTGEFPSIDQCRWIASSTFASRMLAAEDENELRETTVRDLASFSGLYFLGDYVKKSVASGFEALSKKPWGAKLVGGENVVLLNRKKEVAKPVLEKGASVGKKILVESKYAAKKLGVWIKDTELKTASEVANKNTRNLRNLCRVADIAFSMVALGILLPKYNRSVTEKKVAKAKQLEEMQKKAALNYNKNVPEIFKNFVE